MIEESELLFDEAQENQYIEYTKILLTPEQRKVSRNYCLGVPLGWYITWDIYKQIQLREGLKEGEYFRINYFQS